jgi:hypothetical protein
MPYEPKIAPIAAEAEKRGKDWCVRKKPGQCWVLRQRNRRYYPDEIFGEVQYQIRAIAERLLGQPNLSLSSKDDLRFGNHGSLSVNLCKASFFDHESKEGGGIFTLIQREGHDPKEWLEWHGFRPETGNGRAQHKSTGARLCGLSSQSS